MAARCTSLSHTALSFICWLLSWVTSLAICKSEANSENSQDMQTLPDEPVC